MKLPTLTFALLGLLAAGPALGQDSLRALPEDLLTEEIYRELLGEPAVREQPQVAPEQSQPSTRTYAVPLASRGNSIELAVANTTGRAFRSLEITVAGAPGWLQIAPGKSITELQPGMETKVIFSFHLAGQAPVGAQTELVFTASGGQGFTWSKQLSLKVDAPARFELEQNYPNPFNPSTTITYRLPEPMRVTVTVYNLLGRKVTTLSNELQEAGSQSVRWDAGNYSSGLYFYRVVAESEGGKRFVKNKKMTLIK